MGTTGTLRCLVYADPNSRVEFSTPEGSAIIREVKRVFGSKVVIELVDSASVQSGRAFDSNPHIFILPGILGETSHYPEHIGLRGNANIREFVSQGGVFMGFCAGAYYAAETILYQPKWGETKIREKDNLSIISAQAFGPLPGYCEPVAEERARFPKGWHRVDPVPVVICENNRRIEMAYGYGPAFKLAAGSANDINVIARYADIEGTPPAIIEGKFGEGRVMLYGALPQFSHEHDPRHIGNNVPPSLKRLLQSLYDNRDARTEFWDGQMARVAKYCGMAL